MFCLHLARCYLYLNLHCAGGRMRSVRGDELPEELTALGSQALDVAACRAYPARHPLATAIWAELDIETGCYSDIAFRTGDCTVEVQRRPLSCVA